MDVVIYLIAMVISQMNKREWKEFQVGGDEGLFEVKSSICEIDLKNLNLENGSVPYITRSNVNNGIAKYVTEKQNGYSRNRGNVITIGLDTQTIFYQPINFFTGQNIQIIDHEKMSKDVANFLIPLFRIQMEKFNWGGNGATLKRLNALKIMLPVDNNGNPDWDYMEHLGRSIYYKQNKDILGYLVKKMDTLEEEVKNKILSENIEWGLWTIGRLFNIKRVSGRTFESYDKGCFPYITTSSQRNGVNGFVRAVEEDISFRNSLTISPIDGTVFYHSFDFVGRGGAGSSIITLTNKYLNKYTGLFIKTAIECSSRAKASYGVQLNGDRLKATKFKLPINKEGNPDWGYMELYMKKMEYKKLDEVIVYLKNKEF